MGRHLATFATESLDVIKVGDKAAFQSKVCKSLTDCREFKKTNNVCTPREIAQVLYLVGPTWKDGHASRAVTAYIKSKALAERAAWDFIAKEGRHLELSVINPVGIFGPVLGQHYLTSITLVKRLMDGMPGCPRIHFGVVDVRDVADLHIRAMTNPAAKGERFLAVAGSSMSMLEVAKVLRRRIGPAAKKVPRIQLPDWIIRLAAKRNSMLQEMVPQLGKIRNSSNAKAKQLLGWAPRSSEEVITSTAKSLLKFGIVGRDAISNQGH